MELIKLVLQGITVLLYPLCIMSSSPVSDVPRGVMHCFELRTANVDYFVGEEPVAVKDKVPMVNPPETGVGMDLAKVSQDL